MGRPLHLSGLLMGPRVDVLSALVLPRSKSTAQWVGTENSLRACLGRQGLETDAINIGHNKARQFGQSVIIVLHAGEAKFMHTNGPAFVKAMHVRADDPNQKPICLGSLHARVEG